VGTDLADELLDVPSDRRSLDLLCDDHAVGIDQEASAQSDTGIFDQDTEFAGSFCCGICSDGEFEIFQKRFGFDETFVAEFGIGGEVRVGAWAEAKGSLTRKYKGQDLFVLKGTAGAGWGVGIGGGEHFSFRLDRLGFDGKGTLGPFKLGGGVYVNPKAVAELVR